MSPGNAALVQRIADETGCSLRTVYRVLGGDAPLRRGAALERRGLILERAKALGYTANAAARAIGRGRFGVIGLLREAAPQPGIMLLHGLVQAGIEARLGRAGSGLVASTAATDSVAGPAFLHTIAVDGLILGGAVEAPTALAAQVGSGRLALAGYAWSPRPDRLHGDDLDGGRQATLRLLHLGHRRIAFLGDPSGSELRHEGYAQAMENAGLAPWTLRREVSLQTLRATLRRDDRPTALIAEGLPAAMGVLLAAAEGGLAIPGDLSLLAVGHADAMELPRALTCCWFDPGALGEAVAEVMLARLAGAAEIHVAPPYLLIAPGASDGPPR